MAAGKFSFMDIMNARSKEKVEAGAVDSYTEIFLNPFEVEASESNFYSQENIQELADTFLAVGQQQPTVLGRIDGKYKIISGHRRNLANKLLVEQGHEEYKNVRYLYKDMTAATFELSLLVGNAYNRELTAYEKTEQAARLKQAIVRAQREDGLTLPGTLREVVAELLGESSTNVARMDKINSSLSGKAKEEFKNGNLGITAAYETSKLPEDEQEEIAEAAAAGQQIRAKEIAQRVQERKAGDDYEPAHPESITSLCYSCLHYSECNVKTSTCQKCDQYENKAEAEKTEEQRYNEEQDAIDRKTKAKLQEMEDDKRTREAPQIREPKAHEIKIAAMYYNDVLSRKKQFELQKNTGYKVGDNLTMLEFKDGKFTGRTIAAVITYILEEHTGLEEGYCILEFAINYSASVTHSSLSETDTKERG